MVALNSTFYYGAYFTEQYVLYFTLLLSITFYVNAAYFTIHFYLVLLYTMHRELYVFYWWVLHVHKYFLLFSVVLSTIVVLLYVYTLEHYVKSRTYTCPPNGLS